jgi:hypothetical protein
VSSSEPEDQDEGLAATSSGIRQVFSDVGTPIMNLCGGS